MKSIIVFKDRRLVVEIAIQNSPTGLDEKKYMALYIETDVKTITSMARLAPVRI